MKGMACVTCALVYCLGLIEVIDIALVAVALSRLCCQTIWSY